MKGSQRKQHVIALALFGIVLAGFSCYWLRNEDPASADLRGHSSRAVREKQSSSGDPRNAFFGAKPSQIPSGFVYGAPGADVRNSLMGIGSLRVLADSNIDPPGQDVDGPITELTISGASQSAAELIQEVAASSNSKAEAFSQVHALAARHPDPRIREQAVTSLAEVANDLTINHVIETLTDPEPTVRERALEALYKLGNRVPIQALVDLAERCRDAQLSAQVAAFVQQFAERAADSQTHEGFHK